VAFASWGKLLALLAAAAFAAWCHAYQAGNLACCDFDSYANLARIAAERGSFSEPSGTRLYGYPFLLAPIAWIAAHWTLDFKLLASVGQVLSWFAAVLLLGRSVATRFSPRAGNLAFYPLVLFFPIYPYLTTTLADGIAVALLVLVAWRLVPLAGGEARGGPTFAAQWLSVGALLGFSVMVRPANLGWIVVALPFAWATWRRQRALALVALAALATGYFLAIAPQLYLNWKWFARLGFLPTRDIGAEQLRWGMDWIKYGTAMAPDLQQMRYLNPWAPDGPRGLSWYFQAPDAWRTLGARAFAGFDIDYLFPYVRRFDTPWRPWLFLAVHSAVFWSFFGLVRQACRVGRDPAPRHSPLGRYVLSVVLLLGAWFAIHATTAIENRFVLPVLAAMLPLGVDAAWRGASERRWGWLIAWLAYLALAWPACAWLASLRH
jgi:hypothetical protein